MSRVRPRQRLPSLPVLRLRGGGPRVPAAAQIAEGTVGPFKRGGAPAGVGSNSGRAKRTSRWTAPAKGASRPTAKASGSRSRAASSSSEKMLNASLIVCGRSAWSHLPAPSARLAASIESRARIRARALAVPPGSRLLSSRSGLQPELTLAWAPAAPPRPGARAPSVSAPARVPVAPPRPGALGRAGVPPLSSPARVLAVPPRPSTQPLGASLSSRKLAELSIWPRVARASIGSARACQLLPLPAGAAAARGRAGGVPALAAPMREVPEPRLRPVAHRFRAVGPTPAAALALGSDGGRRMRASGFAEPAAPASASAAPARWDRRPRPRHGRLDISLRHVATDPRYAVALPRRRLHEPHARFGLVREREVRRYQRRDDRAVYLAGPRQLLGRQVVVFHLERSPVVSDAMLT